MKKFMLYFVFVAFYSLVIFISCKKETIVVQQVNPCANINCLNGGTCANGTCNCPTGFTGSNCGTQATPSKMRITKIEVLKFSATDASGAGWDPLDGPDLLVKVVKGTNVVWESPLQIPNVKPNTTHVVTPDNPIDLTLPKDRYGLELWDWDIADPNDYMGGISFIPYFSETNKFPSTILLECSTCTVSFRLTVSYSF
jgi:hypothetical protein